MTTINVIDSVVYLREDSNVIAGWRILNPQLEFFVPVELDKDGVQTGSIAIIPSGDYTVIPVKYLEPVSLTI
jgi:hypothetical protein